MAIFDATNTTEERRNYLIQRFHGRVQYLFIESICNDAETIKRNTELKLKYSPDYADMDSGQVRGCFCGRDWRVQLWGRPGGGFDACMLSRAAR